jgi:hypothetical protein
MEKRHGGGATDLLKTETSDQYGPRGKVHVRSLFREPASPQAARRCNAALQRKPRSRDGTKSPTPRRPVGVGMLGSGRVLHNAPLWVQPILRSTPPTRRAGRLPHVRVLRWEGPAVGLGG